VSRVRFRGLYADLEDAGDVFIALAFGEELDDLALARRQEWIFAALSPAAGRLGPVDPACGIC